MESGGIRISPPQRKFVWLVCVSHGSSFKSSHFALARFNVLALSEKHLINRSKRLALIRLGAQRQPRDAQRLFEFTT